MVSYFCLITNSGITGKGELSFHIFSWTPVMLLSGEMCLCAAEGPICEKREPEGAL